MQLKFNMSISHPRHYSEANSQIYAIYSNINIILCKYSALCNFNGIYYLI